MCPQVEGLALLEGLEAWSDKQMRGLELGSAAHLDRLSSSFDSLLKVMDALYQVKVRKAEVDLTLDQLRETFKVLARDKVCEREGCVGDGCIVDGCIMWTIFQTSARLMTVRAWALLCTPRVRKNVCRVHQVSGVSKWEKRLEELGHKWDEIKTQQPQVKGNVEPIQVMAI